MTSLKVLLTSSVFGILIRIFQNAPEPTLVYYYSSCLTIDNIKPEICPNSAPLYNPMSVVDNWTPLFFYSSHFNSNNNKFNPLSRVLKENINKIYKMQHFTTLGYAAYKFFKTFRANPAWAKCVGRDRGGG